ncbi:hypothetical protein D9758_009175 [Tetrapyrgos nigripes]|uniref:Uncharacterized protein n=1 Tax=Tetrapyrgos nigripes TaxID=182062 RepID=A0A8H5G8C4_9AGAR|nr:hypothetical protein D9758_009175 [Tetrapyrgos nigripes]
MPFREKLKGMLNPDESGPQHTVPASTSDTSYSGASTTSLTRFACMSMNLADRLRFMRFNETEIQAIRNTLSMAWFKGIQEERDYYGAHEFKLKGYPWSAQGNEAVPARQMMCAVFETLYNLGWVAISATDISKSSLDKDTTIFRYQDPRPAPCSWMAISFNEGDKLRFIKAPEAIIQSASRAWSSVIQKEKWLDQENGARAYEIKFHGYPWYATRGKESVGVRDVLLQLFEILEQNGFSLYLSLDQNTGPGGDSSGMDTDSWYCRRLNSWTPGKPVYHSAPN